MEPLGVWLEAARPPVRLVVPGHGGRRLILLAYDLGTLLVLAPRVMVWDGSALRAIAARALRRARRISLPFNAGVGDAVGVAGTYPVPMSLQAPCSGPPAPSDLTLRQPIDCVMEGPVA
jgi:hypothetical protein